MGHRGRFRARLDVFGPPNEHVNLRIVCQVNRSETVGQLPHKNVQRFRGGLVFKAHRLCVSLNSRLESKNKAEARGRAVRSVRIETTIEVGAIAPAEEGSYSRVIDFCLLITQLQA